MKNLKAKVEKHPEKGVPKRIFDIKSKQPKQNSRKTAETVLKKIAPDLKIKPDLSQLKYDKVKSSILGKHVLFQQQFNGKPISGAWVRVDLDNKGKVYNIQNDLVPAPDIQKANKTKQATALAKTKTNQLTKKEAIAIALKVSKLKSTATKNIVETELTYFQKDGVPVLSWKVIVKIDKPAREWKYYIDAVSGKILDKINLLKSANGVGKVFDPNPVVALNNTKLEDTSKIPDNAYVQVTLKGLKKTGKLDGPFVTTKTTPNRITRKNLKFIFKREDRAFKEVMVYFHIDRLQRYIQELGFTNVLNKPIPVNIDGETDDNSFYSPSDKALTFGTGGVDDAEDAEIIVHEYGHAIQDNQVPGFGPSGEARAMGEGFGDYLAASFFEAIKPDKLKALVGTWDAVFYSDAKPPFLRRLDSKKKYPKAMTGEEHEDGEIWSSCLWQIRTALGQKKTDKLVIAHHFLLTPKAKFKDAANALITADKNLNNGANGKKIRAVFVKRGIL